MVKPTHSKTDGSGVYFRPGQSILEDGIYRVFHAGHRLSHEVTLLRGYDFPECDKCGKDVHFELLRIAPRLSTDTDFRIKLYNIPHPEESEDEKEAAAS